MRVHPFTILVAGALCLLESTLRADDAGDAYGWLAVMPQGDYSLVKATTSGLQASLASTVNYGTAFSFGWRGQTSSTSLVLGDEKMTFSAPANTALANGTGSFSSGRVTQEWRVAGRIPIGLSLGAGQEPVFVSTGYAAYSLSRILVPQAGALLGVEIIQGAHASAGIRAEYLFLGSSKEGGVNVQTGTGYEGDAYLFFTGQNLGLRWEGFFQSVAENNSSVVQTESVIGARVSLLLIFGRSH